jgi:hypothetical protein
LSGITNTDLLNNYFHDIEVEDGVNEDPYVLTTIGVALILGNMDSEQAKSEKDVPVYVLDNLKGLKNILTILSESDSFEPFSLIVPEMNSQGHPGLHKTPLHFSRSSDGTMEVIITDSKGKGGRYSEEITLFLKSISDELERKTKKPFKLNIFDLVIDRQRDSVNCPIFSLEDAKDFCKKDIREDLMEGSVPSEAESLSPHINYRHIKKIPKELLKRAQSFTEIDKLLGDQITRDVDGTVHRPKEYSEHTRYHPRTKKEVNYTINDKKSEYVIKAYLYAQDAAAAEKSKKKILNFREDSASDFNNEIRKKIRIESRKDKLLNDSREERAKLEDELRKEEEKQYEANRKRMEEKIRKLKGL